MRIAMIGTGYVGLVSGACFSEFGVGGDLRRQRRATRSRGSQRGEMPIYEPGLEQLVATNAAAGRLASPPICEARSAAPTRCSSPSARPSRRGDGHADLSYVFAAAEEIAGRAHRLRRGGDQVDRAGRHRPQGRARSSAASAPEASFDVASNPEFLREGSAIQDFMRPDRVVIGAESERAQGGDARALPPALPASRRRSCSPRSRPPNSSSTPPTPSSPPRSPSSTRSPICARRSAPTSRTWRAASASTAASAASSCMPDRASAARASPRIAARWSRPPQDAGAPLAHRRDGGGGQRRAARRDMAERVIARLRRQRRGQDHRRASASPSSPTPTTCAKSRASPSCRRCAPRARRLRAFDPEGMDEAKKLLPASRSAPAPTRRWRAPTRSSSSPSGTSSARSISPASRALLQAAAVVDLRNIYKPADMARSGLHLFQHRPRSAEPRPRLQRQGERARSRS